MNQWLIAGLIFWLGSGALVVLNTFADGYKEKCKRNGRITP
jgi:hypothetical protein